MIMLLVFPLSTVAHGGAQISSISKITFYEPLPEKSNKMLAENYQTQRNERLPATKDASNINQQFGLGVFILFLVKYLWRFKKGKGFVADEEVN